MFRKTKYYGMIWIFALAATSGAGLAFLKPVSKIKPVTAPATAIKPVPPSSHETTAAHVTPVIFSKTPPKRVSGGAAKAPDAPVFVERANGVYEASTARYTALLSAGEGLRYLPKSKSGKTSELRVRLKSVTSGTWALFDRDTDISADTEVAVGKGAGGISYWRAPSLEECYEPRGDGIEQSFVLDAKPAGEADLSFAFDMNLKDLVALPARAGRNGGILFADKAGAIAVRYGQVMVRDAGGKSLVVEPILDAAAMIAHFDIPQGWLDQAQYPVVIDPLVGTDFAVSNEVGNATGVDQPTVCAGNNNYLVAWTDYTAGPALPQILGATVSQTGTVSTPFAISSNVGAPLPWRFQRIECAFDGSNWLVVWSDDQQASPGVRGAIVGSTGTLLGGTDFLISATTGNVTEDPLATYNGTNFVVAWSDTPQNLTGGSQVYYTFVTSLGVAAQAVAVKSNFTVINQALEYLTAQRPNGDTLLLYQELNEIPALHRSIRIQTSGVVLDPGGTALFKDAEVQTDGSIGYGRPIGAVFNNNEWQILSSFAQIESSAVYLHHLSLTGVVTPPTGIFAEMGLGPIGNQSLDSFAPAFPGASEWLFLRNERVSSTVYHIIGKRVSFDGTDMDPIPFQIDSATRGILRNSVASQGGNLFLVAWLDGRNGASQPADRINVAAALVDSSAAGSIGVPLVAVASASPSSGEAPLTVSFNSLNSTGSYDTLNWDFGDGTSSTLVSPSHIYKNNGTYVAQLRLTKGAYSVFDTAVITVGTGGISGQATPLGVPLANTPPIVPGLFIRTAVVKLDYFNLSNDAATITGVFDVSSLNNTVTGLIAQVSLGGKTFAFNLDAKGQFKSAAGATPVINFAINPATGVFIFQVGSASIRAEMSALGMVNETITPAVPVPLPLTIGVDTLTLQANVETLYHSKKNVTGLANYAFGGTGNEISGAFLVSSFTAQEVSLKGHTFTIKGQLVKPGVVKLNATSGNFKIFLGDYNISLPEFLIVNKNGILTFTAKPAPASGLKKMTFNSVTGAFSLQMVNVPQDDATGGTGLPLAKSGTDIVKVDMNLSFQIDLADTTKLSAGRYMYIGRTTAAAKSWKLR